MSARSGVQPLWVGCGRPRVAHRSGGAGGETVAATAQGIELMKRPLTRLLPCMLPASLVLSLMAGPALADPGATLKTSAEQLEGGQVEAVITNLERAADEGQHHPDLSFNRGLAYLRRSGTASERPGDLGQAAAAFAETLAQRPADAEAQRG